MRLGYRLGMRKVHAFCEDCGKEWFKLNAQAVGAKHARKYGHKVIVEVYQCIIYEGKPQGKYHNKSDKQED